MGSVGFMANCSRSVIDFIQGKNYEALAGWPGVKIPLDILFRWNFPFKPIADKDIIRFRNSFPKQEIEIGALRVCWGDGFGFGVPVLFMDGDPHSNADPFAVYANSEVNSFFAAGVFVIIKIGGDGEPEFILAFFGLFLAFWAHFGSL